MVLRLSTLIFTFSILAGCTGSSNQKAALLTGKQVYKANCTLCHGMDGKLGANGAKDLVISPLTLDQKKEIITNGKAKMLPYRAILSPAEIDSVVAFIEILK